MRTMLDLHDEVSVAGYFVGLETRPSISAIPFMGGGGESGEIEENHYRIRSANSCDRGVIVSFSWDLD